tara:strand:- start:1252 stop:1539 length:288 start_codon:yes stop_codon:yes gene_type:complete
MDPTVYFCRLEMGIHLLLDPHQLAGFLKIINAGLEATVDHGFALSINLFPLLEPTDRRLNNALRNEHLDSAVSQQRSKRSIWSARIFTRYRSVIA